MKEIQTFLEKIQKVIGKNAPYKFEAYSFVMAALHDTVSKLDKARHVSGRELLDGIRQYAIEQYGALAKTVLNYWGVYKTEDFGKIVFALVDVGILRKQPDDKLEEFVDVYDFDEVFSQVMELEDE